MVSRVVAHLVDARGYLRTILDVLDLSRRHVSFEVGGVGDLCIVNVPDRQSGKVQHLSRHEIGGHRAHTSFVDGMSDRGARVQTRAKDELLCNAPSNIGFVTLGIDEAKLDVHERTGLGELNPACLVPVEIVPQLVRFELAGCDTGVSSVMHCLLDVVHLLLKRLRRYLEGCQRFWLNLANNPVETR